MGSYTQIVLAAFTVIGAVWALRHGGRRGKSWTEGVEKQGNEKHFLISMTRRQEGMFREGWAKSTWAVPYVREQIIPQRGGGYLVAKVPCLMVTTSHLIWRSSTGAGTEHTVRFQNVLEGVALEDLKDGTYKIVSASAEVIHSVSAEVPEAS